MKKWYEVYYEFWDTNTEEWRLGSMAFWKFAFMSLLIRCGYVCDDVTDISYVNPKNVEIVSK